MGVITVRPTIFEKTLQLTKQPPTTWSTVFKDSTVTLSNGNLTATNNTGTVAGFVRSNNFKSSGKWYNKWTFDVFVLTSAFGICNSQVTGNASLGFTTVNSYGFFTDTAVRFNGAGSGSWASGVSQGTVCQFAIDIDAKLAWAKAGSGDWNNTPGADPATGTSGIDISGMPLDQVYLAGNVPRLNYQMTLDASGGTTPPTGFTWWP